MKDSNTWFVREEGWLFKHVSRREHRNSLETFSDNNMLQDRPGVTEQS